MVIMLPRRQSFGEKLGNSLGAGITKGFEKASERKRLAGESKNLSKVAAQLTGQKEEDLSGLPPDTLKEIITESHKQQAKFGAQKKMFSELGLSEDFGGQESQEKPQMEPERSDTRLTPEGDIDVGTVKIPTKRLIPETKIAKAAMINPAVADKMQKHNDNIMQQQRHEESLNQKEVAASRKETMSLRKEFVDKAKYAKDAIKNKGNQLKLIRKGNVDSPERVFFASLLPGALGNKLLSADTQLYRAGLFEEFGVLKSMFPGQIRVKEIELLEDKLASLEKSDEAKEKILETGMEKLKIPIIKERAAQRVEKENPKATILEFEKLVDEYSHDELEKAYDEISKSYDKIYFEYAPDKNTLIDKDGHIYKDIPKNLLRQFYEEGDKEGLELRPL
jgi:hypothetical protein